MSFIRRSDGTVVHTGGHVGSRGSLESIRHGGAEDFSEISEEEREWEQRVLTASVSIDEAFYLQWHENYGDLDMYDIEVLERLWGVYEGDCPHLRREEFNEAIFSPSGR